MKVILIFELIVLTFLLKNVPLHACNIKCRTKFYFAQNGSVFAGHALNGFAYRNVTVVNPKACFHRCLMDDRCISFNYHTTSKIINCQLNEENRNTKPQAMVATLEFDYYDLVIDYPPEVEGSHADACSDNKNCGKSHPCLNGGQCVPNYDKNGKRFVCHCPPKFTGALCQTKRPRDCVEVWDQGWRQSGQYVVLDQNENNLTVYCDLTSEPEYIWTLVESFSLENVGQFRYLPFFQTGSIAINEDNPDWSEFKMSHAHMQHVRARSTHWRATCNYPTRDIDYTDYLRTSFDHFDLLVDPVTSPKCQTFELINIRGISCMECTAAAYYGGNNGYTFHIDSQRSSSVNGCQFDGSAGAVSSEDNFGHYGRRNTAFSCTKSSISTTQIWFGSKK